MDTLNKLPNYYLRIKAPNDKAISVDELASLRKAMRCGERIFCVENNNSVIIEIKKRIHGDLSKLIMNLRSKNNQIDVISCEHIHKFKIDWNKPEGK